MEHNDQKNATSSGKFSERVISRPGSAITTRVTEIPDHVKRNISRNIGIGTGTPRTDQYNDNPKG